jgi:hypothetical protein
MAFRTWPEFSKQIEANVSTHRHTKRDGAISRASRTAWLPLSRDECAAGCQQSVDHLHFAKPPITLQKHYNRVAVIILIFSLGKDAPEFSLSRNDSRMIFQH